MDLKAFDAFRLVEDKGDESRPLVVWNHRWEYDKNPIGFFRILYRLLDRGLDFDLALLGERFEEEPHYFVEARRRFGDRIVQYGRAERFGDYAQWLWRSDIALVTSNQDFFGGSVVEALYCDCHAVLPQRLAYTDHLNPNEHPEIYYKTEDEAIERLSCLFSDDEWTTQPRARKQIKRYDWSNLIAEYDTALASLASSS